MKCPACNNDVPEGSTACPSCGAPLGAAVGDTAVAGAETAVPGSPAGDTAVADVGAPVTGGSQPVPDAPHGAAEVQSPVREVGFDAGRWSLADVVVGLASLLLAISVFLDWYTFNLPLGVSTSRSGTWTREYLYAALALSVEVLVYLAARSVWRGLQFKSRLAHDGLLVSLTTGSLVVTLLAFTMKPQFTQGFIPIPVDWAYGAYLSVAGAAVAMVVSVGQLVADVAAAPPEPVAVAAVPEEASAPAEPVGVTTEAASPQPGETHTPSTSSTTGAGRHSSVP